MSKMPGGCGPDRPYLVASPGQTEEMIVLNVAHQLHLVTAGEGVIPIDFFFFKDTAPPRNLPFSPPRRSSDLGPAPPKATRASPLGSIPRVTVSSSTALAWLCAESSRMPAAARSRSSPRSSAMRSTPCFDRRSEEHTSELQSQSNLVCSLLLEK